MYVYRCSTDGEHQIRTQGAVERLWHNAGKIILWTECYPRNKTTSTWQNNTVGKFYSVATFTYEPAVDKRERVCLPSHVEGEQSSVLGC